MTDPLWSTDASDLADWVRVGEVKAVELLDIALERIGRYDGAINSFVVIDPDSARAQAEEVDSQVAAGEDPGPLAGIPVGVKDLENAAGLPTTFGSLLFKDNYVDTDSTQVARLRNAGAVILGKVTTPELGSIGYTSSKLSGVTNNPWNLDRTPGGSSGGSAAAVSAGLVPLATGSDGGGSIRAPASYCGLPGLKPTFGRVPRGPGRISASNLSSYGPLARSIRDIARYLDQVASPHSMDPLSLPEPGTKLEDNLDADLSGMRAAWSSSLGFGECDSEVAHIARASAERFFEAAGIEEVDVEINLPDVADAWATAQAMDCYSDLDRFWPERADEMTPVISLAMRIAESLLPSQLADAARGRHEICRLVNEVFDRVDFILTPTTPTVAFDAGGPMPDVINGRFVNNPLIALCFTYPFNLTGQPALSIPAGLNAEGLPVGLQIVGRRFTEDLLLSAGALCEERFEWPKLAPGY